MSILIRQVLVNGKQQDIFIHDDRIDTIGVIKEKADIVIDGKGKALLPAFANCHTHAAMTLFRSFGDDMELFDWLQNRIWPVEAKLTPKDVYWATKLACVEMIKSGTTLFSDMYFHPQEIAQAASEMGIRVAIGEIFLDVLIHDTPTQREQKIKHTMQEIAALPLAIPTLCPHSIYTVNAEHLQWVAEQAKKNNWFMHMHLSETIKEVKDCITLHKKRPVEYLSELDVLHPKLRLAHAVHINDAEAALLAKNNVAIVHNPVSNMKLSVGKALPYELYKKHNVRMTLGTDGCGSNNNLDMFEEMKIATLLQKFVTGKQTVMPAREIFDIATRNGFTAFGIDAGEIAVGKRADLMLIDLKHPEFVPNHDLIANAVYAANGNCVDTVICNGKIVMQDRKIPREEEIMEHVQKCAERLFSD